MDKKIENTFIYQGLGFPVKLENVEILKIDGEWHPKIDVRKVSEQAIKMLISRNERLTGNQVRFIRTYFSMSLREFAKEVVRESHTAVAKWEATLNEMTKMDINIEMMLRLYVIERLEAKTVEQRNRFYEKYLELKKLCLSDRKPSPLNLRISAA
jgi:DNA-binding transcriptional regulator YiaG